VQTFFENIEKKSVIHKLIFQKFLFTYELFTS